MELESNTSGIEIKTQRAWLASSVELLSSMRFAISLLTIIAIASIIGTVLKQNEPLPNYVNQFGPFWFEVFQHLSLYSLYSAWWFLTIMGFLVLSTSLCLIRNAPKMLKDMRSWRDNVREQSLRNFHHKAEWHSTVPAADLTEQLSAKIKRLGYQFKVVNKDQATLIAAKQGAGNKWGYIFAHAAIVVICVGGLLDSDLAIRFQTWFGGKVPFEGSGVLISQIPAQHKLSLSNPTFRGNIAIPEGMSGNTAVIPQTKGVLLQDLPFTIELKKFNIDFYSTGMPKLFASEVVIKDHETGKSFPATVKVNHPLIYKGIAVFQSSFDDGGSRLKIKAHPMQGSNLASFDMDATIGGATLLSAQQTGDRGDFTIEWTGFRPFNVENMVRDGQDLRAVNPNENFAQKLRSDLDKHSGSAGKNANNKDLKNVGPSMQYKLRDKTGQAREFHNYMVPVQLEGRWVFLAGTRESPNEAFRYLRIPADENDSVNEWMRLRAALADPELRAKAAEVYAKRALPASSAQSMQSQLAASAKKGLGIFAGEGATPKLAGYTAIAGFLENIPSAEQGKAADVFMKILNGSMWDLWQLARQKDGLPVLELNEKRAEFLQLATAALSDAFFYGAPVYLQMTGFEEIKASVFQVTRAPGQNVVYLGCLFLVIGVFAMFYIRERRLWLWIKQEGQQTSVLMALSSQRKTLDFEKDFEQLKLQLGVSDKGGNSQTETPASNEV
ncbi:cytochrome c biogenesis protein ResB [Undibacterium danionis]|uniref:Cytochrome c biogenesis protein ResB n=1 Tax=Undibacterium danionis TaxID=1812100 RepID=A0ABV6IAQ1_9BURK